MTNKGKVGAKRIREFSKEVDETPIKKRKELVEKRIDIDALLLAIEEYNASGKNDIDALKVSFLLVLICSSILTSS